MIQNASVPPNAYTASAASADIARADGCRVAGSSERRSETHWYRDDAGERAPTRALGCGASEQDRAGDLTLLPFHPADLGTDAIDAELDVSNATRISDQLAEIDAALQRLYAAPDRFGTCEDTGEQIPFARLQIIPWARTCGQAEQAEI